MDEAEFALQLARAVTGRFVVQEHYATRLHWDLRLEMGRVLKSWAVPDGPSRDPCVRRRAIQVKDHALSCLTFENPAGVGPDGAGQVYLWDGGEFVLREPRPLSAWEAGELSLTLYGTRLRGDWKLSRTLRREGDNPAWAFQKLPDDWAIRGDRLIRLGDAFSLPDLAGAVAR